jgi:L-lactate dehydrogenase complex protein LldF
MAGIEIGRYREVARESLDNQTLQRALSGMQQRIGRATAQKYKELPEGPDLRFQAREIRLQTLAGLDVHLERLAERIRGRGGQVFFAQTGEEAVAYCLEVAVRHQVRSVVKGKSMVSEEIGLNQALESAGIQATETDLGEYIVQLAGEHPSHIIAPAIHKTREEVGRLFADKLGIAYTDDPAALTQAAREALREKFLTADMGVTGCNLACAETGHITTLSNEGNIRMASTLPRVHVALMGMERIVPNLQDHDILFRLLSRGAAAQNLAGYVSYVGGPAAWDQVDGPEEFHLIVLDNGRSRILADPEFRELLCCIRCGACLNVCPVYGKIGGYAYGHPYPGPIGSVLTPLLSDIGQARDLCFGEALCGACRDACPVNLDIPRMLLALRHKCVQGCADWGVAPGASKQERMLYSLWARAVSNRSLYNKLLKAARWGQKLAPRSGGWLRKLPGPLSGWTASRDLPPMAECSFIEQWKKGKFHPEDHITR